MTAPVRFGDAVAVATNSESGQGALDLWIEVGSGGVLTGLVGDDRDTPVMPLDAGGSSLVGLLNASAAAYVLGVDLHWEALFENRFFRPISLDWKPKFFANPCELAPVSGDTIATAPPSSGSAPGHRNGSRMPDKMSPVSTGGQASRDSVTVIIDLVARRAELPVSSIQADNRFLSDLHLNSIAVGQIVAESARELGVSPPLTLSEYANASIAELATAMDELVQGGGTRTPRERFPRGVDDWVRAFRVHWVEATLSHRQRPRDQSGSWEVFAPVDYPYRSLLLQRLEQSVGGHGILICLPDKPDVGCVRLLLSGARQALKAFEDGTFVLLQSGVSAAGFAKSLFLEAPHLNSCVVSVPRHEPKVFDELCDEIRTTRGYHEVRFDDEGRRWKPELQLSSLKGDHGELPLGPSDVLIVSGGGRGIGAECAIALGRESGCRLVLLGRGDPATDPELIASLKRLQSGGIRFQYYQVDLTNPDKLQETVARAVDEVGPITALIHSAGTNRPQLLNALEESAFRRTLAPKVVGLHNLLAAIDRERLKLLVTFSSIIGRLGLPGQADYAVANEWLSAATEEFQRDHAACRCLAIEWSVWSDVGMGERLGSIDSLVEQGIAPISPQRGVAALVDVLKAGSCGSSVVISGRFGEPPALSLARTELPLLRFLERSRVYYPGIELVVDVDLSLGTDPYLDDHIFHGERLFPAVMGMEAMTQAAMAVTAAKEIPNLTDVRLLRPLVVPTHGTLTVRIVALVNDWGSVKLALRSDATDFQVNHFEATCTWDSDDEDFEIPTAALDSTQIDLEPEADLYQQLFFHRGRFQRVRGYRLLRARHSVADVAVRSEPNWFGQYLPQRLILGDPGARDAALHSIQASIPHRRILPVGLDRLIPIRQWETETSQVIVSAKERFRKGDDFVYDVRVADGGGRPLEVWDGLRLRAVADIERVDPWPAPLVGPYLERRLEELMPPGDRAVEPLEQGRRVNRGFEDPSVRTSNTLVSEQGRPIRALPQTNLSEADDVSLFIDSTENGLVESTDGNGEAPDTVDGLTLAISPGWGFKGDIESVESRSDADWQELLGPDAVELAKRLSQKGRETFEIVATRLLAARRTLERLGFENEPVIAVGEASKGWRVLESGSVRLATVVVVVRNQEQPIVISVLETLRHASV